MTRRSSRSDATIDKEALLQALGGCRRALIEVESRAEIGGPLYKNCDAVLAAIDALAEVLTGDRQYFWPRLHSAGGSKGA